MAATTSIYGCNNLYVWLQQPLCMAADIAADTELKALKDSKAQAVEIEFLGAKQPQGITFVMKSGANWYKTEKGHL